MSVLNKVNFPKDIKNLSIDELNLLSSDIRKMLIDVVSKNGGHIGPNLGVVELTLAIHYVFNTPFDTLIWDVGHQVYTHKIITGRKEEFDSIRLFGGLSGFPKRSESEYDTFNTGHAGTSISQAVGCSIANNLETEKRQIIAVIGDGSLTEGMALEGLNSISEIDTDMIIIINDNKYSIVENIGAIERNLEKLRNHTQDITTIRLKENSTTFDEIIKGNIFENFGIQYFGPVDGHNIEELIKKLEKLKNLKGPKVLHVETIKGKGLNQALANPPKYHGLGSFIVGDAVNETQSIPKPKTYSQIWGEIIEKLMRENDKTVILSPATPVGTAIDKIAKIFPERYFDLGISEQSVVGTASGLSFNSYFPIISIYSSFLQRAYDQVIHDLCIPSFPALIAIDRGGLVQDGETHHGVFDISFLRPIPNIIIASPKDDIELEQMTQFALNQKKPVAIRIPRDTVSKTYPKTPIVLGKSELIKNGNDLAILTFGPIIDLAEEVISLLEKENLQVRLYNMRFVKPIDKEAILNTAKECKLIVTLEENSIIGGLGSAVTEIVAGSNLNTRVLKLAIPDQFIPHGDRKNLFSLIKFEPKKIYDKIMSLLELEPINL
ncbi:MAG: 1-deoxy-D-xylulose-5-phosphate synthase [Candidatus Heimdallarchaeota archaeon]|nr:1-deoxy-D-xylulose-5-phosphate synthase [Candidatus Heimdallarchaeota archaeon]